MKKKKVTGGNSKKDIVRGKLNKTNITVGN
jgi:hypothetical protein